MQVLLDTVADASDGVFEGFAVYLTLVDPDEGVLCDVHQLHSSVELVDWAPGRVPLALLTSVAAALRFKQPMATSDYLRDSQARVADVM